MIIMEHSTFDGSSIVKNLGAPEYSYWFVRKAFRPILQRFGVVIPILEPEREVDAIHSSARAQGIPSVFLSFNPPHCTPVDLACPTVPIFAWEYDTIPTETWHGDPHNNWRHVLARSAAAITHSNYSLKAVRRSLGDGYPIWAIPAPVFDATAHAAQSAQGWREPFELTLTSGLAIDSRAIDLSLFRADRANAQGVQALGLLERAAANQDRKPQTLTLSGVIYSSVFNPVDGRKNWMDMVAGFVWAFRSIPDATLILKVAHRRMLEGVLPIMADLGKLGPFKCRVIVIHGLLASEEYAALVEATSYTVNTSRGEGQCLPLMEFMSAGRPAVAPRHTAMVDYISDDNAFVVDCHMRPAFWPHDFRQATRCLKYQPSFTDLVRCYRDSFRVARHEPARYQRMSAAAGKAMKKFCSNDVVTAGLTQVFDRLTGRPSKQMETA
ncbi:MAG: glycosyl transferase group 1 family protein [Rhodospirillales bacterium]|nr:glycosyl transferase group 1 family protein [Rhodospirillales bacterium]